MIKNKNLLLKDFWVYICLLENRDKSLKELSEISKYSIPIIRASIKTLEREGYVVIEKKGRKQCYTLKIELKYKFKKMGSIKETVYFIALQLFYD